MQPEDIVLIPPTHEISTPSFHVKDSLSEAFRRHLESGGIEIVEEPSSIGGSASGKNLVELRAAAGTPMDRLEKLLDEFARQKGLPPSAKA